MKRRDVTRGTTELARVRVHEAQRKSVKSTVRITVQGHCGARLLEYEQGTSARAGAGGAGQRWRAAAVARGVELGRARATLWRLGHAAAWC